jgi:hypothetical protein
MHTSQHYIYNLTVLLLYSNFTVSTRNFLRTHQLWAIRERCLGQRQKNGGGSDQNVVEGLHRHRAQMPSVRGPDFQIRHCHRPSDPRYCRRFTEGAEVGNSLSFCHAYGPKENWRAPA